MGATAFQRRRRELEKQNTSVVGDMTVMDPPEASPATKKKTTKSKTTKTQPEE